VRQLPEQCASCGRQIATLETCVLPDGTEKRGVGVTFKESAEGLLGEAIAITGNAKALLQLRAQIDRALGDETWHPFEEGVYQDVDGIPFEVAVKRARSKEEMREPVPRPNKTAERMPWAEKARGGAEEGSAEGRRD
jgi:hypothetical protein